MTQADKKVQLCLNKAEKEGEKHKGLRRVPRNEIIVKQHISKAQRNLMLIEHLIELQYTDWAVSAVFYSIYHCLLAILWRYGYESKNQACTFAMIETLIENKQVNMTINELRRIQESTVTHEETIVDLREFYQYGTDTEVAQTKIVALQQEAKEFVARIRTMLQ